MRSIAILGAGELGGALARQLAAADIASRILLIDDGGSVAAGKALDIAQAAPIDNYSTTLAGSTDETSVVGVDVVVVADRAKDGSEWRGEAGLALVRRVAHLNPAAVILCAGSSHLDLVEGAVREGGLSRLRVFGSAGEALRAAVVSMAALEADVSPLDVNLTVVGRPPAQTIVPWNEASIGGYRAIDVLPPPALTRLDARLPRLWPPGPVALASAAARMLKVAATRGSDSLIGVVTMTRDEGNGGRAAMLPVTVGVRGITRVLTPSLSTRDRVRLESALQ